MSWFDEMANIDVPEGRMGPWEVRQYEVTEEAAKMDALRGVTSGTARHVRAGTYTGLFRGGSLIMSNTLDEIRDHHEPLYQAHRLGGRVLINGLGLGMITAAICKLDNVTEVVVIEKAQDVIDLVGDVLVQRYLNLRIIHANAFEYTPPRGSRYSVVWHDIWDDLCEDNLEEMATLHRRYGRRAEWQGSWGKELLRYWRSRRRR